MKNQAFIKLLGEDDTKYVDLNEFGVTLIRGWREALLTPAPVKSYVSNDSRLEHGISMVATAGCTKVNQREICLCFWRVRQRMIILISWKSSLIR